MVQLQKCNKSRSNKVISTVNYISAQCYVFRVFVDRGKGFLCLVHLALERHFLQRPLPQNVTQLSLMYLLRLWPLNGAGKASAWLDAYLTWRGLMHQVPFLFMRLIPSAMPEGTEDLLPFTTLFILSLSF
jgi:hypothetical protein